MFIFEDSPAKGKPAETAYIEEVRKSDIYIGVLGKEYGGAVKVSPTESEFREAKAKSKEILIYI